MNALIRALVDALYLGSLYALYALGVAMIFGIMRLINFAHASLIAAGAYAPAVTTGQPLALRIVFAVAVCVGLALLLELVAFRSLRGADPATLPVTSFAVYVTLTAVFEAVFGSLPTASPMNDWFQLSWVAGSLYLPTINGLTLVVVGVLLIGLSLFLAKTRWGLQMRAAAEDFSTARLLGVRANRVIMLAFAISGMLAAAAAILLVGKVGTVTPTFGIIPVLFGLIAAVVGGLSSLRGAVLGGFVIGITSQLLQYFLPEDLRPFRDAFLFATVFLIPVFRPQGLISPKQGVRV
ncbi:branched-chain amino acid ABC transporter permease [Nocardioides sp. B-3]|uniref:branched-chain amino acid ABC transporter permease n=1 Tax=Nocardioides sp. B-3 TaxID=2895565 RepID=UPI002152DE0A|nr:branched-chain amino acid ABC transporter permease [Nocardioides sp. B-3]UUZ59047.1 branched-chain amino acid ABC transporter permease [Nocardioides sp. B-3]